jgi:hypothetical protein
MNKLTEYFNSTAAAAFALALLNQCVPCQPDSIFIKTAAFGFNTLFSDFINATAIR